MEGKVHRLHFLLILPNLYRISFLNEVSDMNVNGLMKGKTAAFFCFKFTLEFKCFMAFQSRASLHAYNTLPR
jgi:hypothetical protein